MVPVLLLFSLQSTVSLELTATSAKNLMPKLTEITGVKHAVSTDLAGEILVVRVKDTTPEALRAKLGDACYGEWKIESDGTQVLWRSPGTQKKVEDRELEIRTEEIRGEIQELAKEAQTTYSIEEVKKSALKLQGLFAGKQPPGTYYSRNTAVHQSPAKRALIKLLAAMDPKVLVMNQEERRVFSNLPTKMQLPLPSSAKQVAQQFFEEQKVWAEVLASMPGTLPDMNYAENPFLQKEALTEVPRRFLLIARHTNNMSPVSLQLTVLNSQGHPVANASLWLTTDGVRLMNSQFDKPVAPEGSKLALSQRARDFENLVSGYLKAGKADPKLLTADHRRLYLHPEEHDLLGFAVSEGLIQRARVENQNLVANLPDVAFMTAAFILDANTMTTETLLKRAVTLASLDMRDDAGWLVLRPNLPLETAFEREHRQVMGEFLRFRDENGYVPAWLAAKRALANPAHPFLADIISMIITPKGAISEVYDWQVLRFYGSMSDRQRDALNKGVTLRLGDLSPEARLHLHRLAYGSGNFSWRSNTEDYNPERVALLMEPTEAMPDGLPKDLTIRARVASEPILQAVYDGNMPAFSAQQIFNLETIGYLTVAAEKDPNGEHSPLPPKFKLGATNTYFLHISFSPSLSKEEGIKEIRIEEDKTYTLQTLPDDIKKKIKASTDAYRNQEWQPERGKKPPPPVSSR